VKNVIVFALASLLLITCIGCKRTDEPEESTTGTSTETSESTTNKVDFGGYEFVFMNANQAHAERALWYDEPQTAQEQAVMDAMDGIASEYDCRFANVENADTESIAAACESGVKLADFICEPLEITAFNGYFRRLDTDEVRACGMDVLNAEQFDATAVKACSVAGEVYNVYISGGAILPHLGYFYAFNKELVAGAGYPAEVVYQAVRDGVWTWDVFLDICRAGTVYNSETEKYDVYGLSTLYVKYEILTMCDGLICYDGERIASGLGDVSCISAISTVVNRMYNDPGIVYEMPKYSSSSKTSFYSENALFCPFDSLYLLGFGDFDFEYGIVPLPKGSASSGYTSPILSTLVGYATQTANSDWQTSCYIFGLLASRLNDSRTAIEAMTEYLPDAESLEMLRDYVMPNIKIDYILLSDGAASVFWKVQTAVEEGVSAVEAVEQYSVEFDAAVESAFEAFNK